MLPIKITNRSANKYQLAKHSVTDINKVERLLLIYPCNEEIYPRLRNAGLDRHFCGSYSRSTVVDGLSVLSVAVSLVNEWRLS